MTVVAAPLHNVWGVTAFTVGVGFTVMVNVLGVPGQPLAVGVTVTVAVTGALPVLVAANGAMSPFPLAGKPMLGSELVQANVVPATVPVKAMLLLLFPLQIVWLVTAFTVGTGFTVTFTVAVADVQPFTTVYRL